ncbi:pilus assembly PilX family protein [Ralstonia solanacearum]|uniref:Putative type IV pilus assembly protein PilX n=1 Tax=Ralstonia solanacearum (strain Po82) TaxID=1031711 RepID=F6G4X7_RALS8|nr:pilus assembly protein [Ralstonia solanacearum]AEG69932.1 Putative type IV pilus assembly protein PilX [Ralstonia solanacearum Po82]AMP68092.1 pilus assembly protein PilX [Ralstonia solanacearum]AMP75002.1 pilus assembly protein PilX [Ralstonia solanacearum]AYB61381.1 pilus assembly protein PilX [Ralstonia solanacearum]MBB6585155.1 pilus assembly protein [Ralstonia solanacearum]
MPLNNVRSHPHAAGFALITALIMLLVITILALGGARLALDSKRISRNQRDNSIAFQAAEAALRDAERDIENAGNAPTSRSSQFTRINGNLNFPGSGCLTGGPESAPNTRFRGLCTTTDETNPIWNNVSWKDSGANSQTVGYGDFTGQSFPIGQGVLPSQPPRYIIEALVDKTMGGDAGYTGGAANSDGTPYIFRITAVGWGPYGSAPVMLQSYYRKSDSNS